MKLESEKSIFKKGSTTYYFSSKFFPKAIRQDVFKLYSFVRVADDYVDAVPQDTAGFKRFRNQWDQQKTKAAKTEVANKDERVINNMVYLVNKYSFDFAWVEVFLDAMQSDINQKPCKTFKDTVSYTYGSAEVIGLMMTKIMDLPEKSYTYAQLQGRAMQLVNFIRDVQEDNQLGRQYLPVNEMKKFGLKNLSKKEALAKPEEFKKFMQFQIDRYKKLQSDAEQGFKYIPKRYVIPIKTAADMYNWAADQIAVDPLIVFEKKVKPRKRRVLIKASENIVVNIL